MKTKIEEKKISDLLPDNQNVNTHTQRGRGVVEHSVRKYGIGRGIVAAGKGTETPQIIGGNLTHEIVGSLDMDDVVFVHTNGEKLIVTVRDDIAPNSPEAIALGIIDNESQKQSYNPDLDILAAVMADPAMQALRDEDKILAGLVEGMGKPQAAPLEPRKTLAERFGVPPFSVLNARSGWWQERKSAWIALGIQSELGRGDNLQGLSEQNDEYRYNKKEYFARKADAKSFNSGGAGQLRETYKEGTLFKSLSGRVPDYYDQKTKKENELGVKLTNEDFEANHLNIKEGSTVEATGTSIFDPVLCELAYRWFMPQVGGAVLDPFAGGSVRGVVASILGKDYTGIDLSARQIEANEQQGRDLCKDKQPRWINGNSVNIKELAGGEYDFIFSCPPYADLEVYSDDPADLSRMEYADFIKAYREIIAHSVSMLKDNRFACFVVGDIRDSKGFYRNFPAHTIDAFQDAGMILYNEAILVTAIGSLPIRVGRQFDGGRKLGKTHQNVLVFYKGNPKAIKDFGAVEFGEVEELESADEIPD